MKSSFYESGKKAGKLLAGQLKKQETSSEISYVRGDNGKIVTSAKEIYQVFMAFYKSLYTSDTASDPEKLEGWFPQIDLLSLSPEQVQLLDTPVIGRRK